VRTVSGTCCCGAEAKYAAIYAAPSDLSKWREAHAVCREAWATQTRAGVEVAPESGETVQGHERGDSVALAGSNDSDVSTKGDE